jgi:hypothetical protein
MDISEASDPRRRSIACMAPRGWRLARTDPLTHRPVAVVTGGQMLRRTESQSRGSSIRGDGAIGDGQASPHAEMQPFRISRPPTACGSS